MASGGLPAGSGPALGDIWLGSGRGDEGGAGAKEGAGVTEVGVGGARLPGNDGVVVGTDGGMIGAPTED